MRWQYKVTGNSVAVDIIIQGNLAFSPVLSLNEFSKIICSERPQFLSTVTRIITSGGTPQLIQFINQDVQNDVEDHNIIEMLIEKMKAASDTEIAAGRAT